MVKTDQVLQKILGLSLIGENATQEINILLKLLSSHTIAHIGGFFWKFNNVFYPFETGSAVSLNVLQEVKLAIARTIKHKENVKSMKNGPSNTLGYHVEPSSVPDFLITHIPLTINKNLKGLLSFLVPAAHKKVFQEQVPLIMGFVAQLKHIIIMNELQLKLKQFRYESVSAMVAVIEALDYYTRDHSKNVANYALLLAEELKLAPAQIQVIYYGALFHDIGKIGVSFEILQKPGKLTADEYDIMKQHPGKGAKILGTISDFQEYVPIALYHHEMFSGGGYPEGLVGQKIPFNARLVAIVDAYDAITTNRSYRKAQGCRTAIDVIVKNTPKQFDPEIVDAFVRVEKNL